jgi:hypothetical protein
MAAYVVEVEVELLGGCAMLVECSETFLEVAKFQIGVRAGAADVKRQASANLAGAMQDSSEHHTSYLDDTLRPSHLVSSDCA